MMKGFLRDVMGSRDVTSMQVVPAWPVDDGSELECALLSDVLGEVRYLTGKMRQEVGTQKVCSEWKFAAMVVDRLCLWLFSIFTLVSSGVIFLSAPDATYE